MKFLGQGCPKLEHEQDRQTRRQTDTHTPSHTDTPDQTYYHIRIHGF